MKLRTVKEADVAGKRILLRCDLDVPLDTNGDIKDDTRLVHSVATIKHLLLKQARQIVIIGHVGRPKAQVVENLRTKKISIRLGELLHMPVAYIDKCLDVDPPQDQIVVLENLRFCPGEESNDSAFAQKLSLLCDIYVNDAFAVAHRSNASTDAITRFRPSYAGLHFAFEVETMTNMLEKPERPFMAVLGGAKLETKVPVIKNLLPKVDKILIGGSMVFSFFKSLGFEVGKSQLNKDVIALAKDTLERSKDKIILPEEIVVADSLTDPREIDIIPYNDLPSDRYGVDIAPAAIEEFTEILKDAKTILWNGPMGVYEMPEFAKGTEMLARALSSLDAKVIVGGGDSAAAIAKLGLKDRFAHISSGGGASLSLLGGKALPSIIALQANVRLFP